MEIPLDLRRHCIETEIRRQYRRALEAALRSASPPPHLEAHLELLVAALEALDFPRLRSAHRVLAGSAGGEPVALCGGPGEAPWVAIAGRRVDP
jgi:hypothetical protein